MYDTHVFDCIRKEPFGRNKRWDGYWFLKPSSIQETSELLIKGRGSMYHVILGSSSEGNYLCIPEQRISCPLSYLSDVFWNLEQLTDLLGPVDATTIATALADFEKCQKTG